MKNMILIFVIVLMLSSNAFAVEYINFIDIDGHWAKNEIQILAKENAVNGYGDNSFKPNNNITVSEFLKILIEMVDYDLIAEGNVWPDWYIATAIENKLIDEMQFENYSLPLTRGNAVKIIANYIELKDVVKSSNKFIDLKSGEKENVLKLTKLNIINGYSDNTFRSNNLITRAEACKIILKAYEAKKELLKNRKVELSSAVTNIKTNDVSNIKNTYEIKDNRIYIYDTGRYAKLSGQTLNQEYINDKKVIKLLTNLVDEESYTELKFVPDKYIINSLTIYYGNNSYKNNNCDFAFEIKFYENAYYDVAFSKDNPNFMKDACIKIRTGKMWDKNYERENEASCNEKNIFKLKESIGIVLDETIKDEFIEYIIEKRIEANKIPNSEIPKINEVKKIGKYTINTFCIKDNDLEIYIKK